MNDFQNAYETGKLIRYREQAARNAEIAAITAAGRFALIGQMATYCPFTDATAGTASHLIAAYDTREEANAAAAKHYEDFPAEIDYFVLPELPRKQQAPIDFTDIPF